MSNEQNEKLIAILQEIMHEIESLPDSSSNGLLIDAASHAHSSAEHLRRYFQQKGGK